MLAYYVASLAAGLVLGAIAGVLWGRKHPATVATLVDVAKKL